MRSQERSQAEGKLNQISKSLGSSSRCTFTVLVTVFLPL